jgi:hypothetical protein
MHVCVISAKLPPGLDGMGHYGGETLQKARQNCEFVIYSTAVSPAE